MKIKEQVVSASFQYHKDIDARLEGIQIGDSSFRLVKTAEDGESEYKNYLVKTPQNYSIFNFRDVLKGRVRTLKTFTLHEIRNSETRKSFAKKIFPIIKEHKEEESFASLESFMRWENSKKRNKTTLTYWIESRTVLEVFIWIQK